MSVLISVASSDFTTNSIESKTDCGMIARSYGEQNAQLAAIYNEYAAPARWTEYIPCTRSHGSVSFPVAGNNFTTDSLEPRTDCKMIASCYRE